MIDSQFDDFAKGQLGDHEVPVPADLWNKIKDGQFDQLVAGKLRDQSAPVPPDLWNRITDAQFDEHIGNKLSSADAVVPAGLWERIEDGRFDDFVRDRLSGATAPVPAGLWEKVMPEDSDDKGAFIWFRNAARMAALFLLIAGLAIGGFYWYRAAQPEQPSGSLIPGTTPLQPGNEQALRPTPPGPGNNTTNAEQASPADQPQTATTGADNPAGPISSAIATGGAAPNPSSDVSDPRHLSRNTPAPLQETGVTTGRSGALPPIAESRRTVDQTAQAEMPLGFPEPYQYLQFSRGNTITSLSTKSSLAEIDRKLGMGNHAAILRSIIVCPPGRGGNTDWFLEAYASPDLAFRSFSNNHASQQYINRKDSSESMRPGFTAGIRLVKPLTDKWLLKAGLQYAQVNQKYVYRTDNEIKDITTVTTRTIIRAPGDTIVVRDTSVMQQIGYKNNAVINRFRSVDIPVTIGYQFGDDDWKIGLNAGFIVNLSSWYQGMMLDSSLATVPIQKGSNNTMYKSNIGLGLYGGVSIVKRLSDDLHIFAEPYFRYNLSDMTTPNAAYNQKFSIGGISLGVRLNLNRQ